MGVLENDYVKAGVNKNTGTLGSGGNTSPGLLYDSTGSGTFNPSYDYLTPGSPFDGWSIKIDGVNSTNNNASGQAWTDSDGLTDSDNGLVWLGTNSAHSGWEVENTYSLGATSEHVEIDTSITAGSAADDVYFGRFIDPDARASAGDSSSTDNVLGYSGIPASNVAFSEALESRYALGLYSTDSNVDAGITRWTTDADSYTHNLIDGEDDNTNTGDNTIGLTWHWEDVNAGDILEAKYAYIFGPSAFDAADTAIDAGAGGGTPGETPTSWGDVEDVGSATDAADSVATPASPTIVGSASSSITRHTASESGDVQTITRTKSTSTYDVYSDSSVGDTTVTTEQLTPFTGRTDQIATAKTVHKIIVRGLDFDGVSAIGSKVKADNGLDGSTRGISAGTVKENDGYTYSIGVAKLDTKLSSVDSADADTLYAQGSMSKGNFTFGVQASTSDYSYERTIGDFSNTGSTKQRSLGASITYSNPQEHITPVFSLTKGISNTKGYTEAGSIQSARTIDSVNDSFGYVTVGFDASISVLDISARAHSDNVASAKIGISHGTEQGTFGIGVTRIQSDKLNTNNVEATLKFKF